MIDHLGNKVFVPYAALANPVTYTADMHTHVSWPTANPLEGKKKHKMTLETAQMFLIAAREVLAERAAPAPPHGDNHGCAPHFGNHCHAAQHHIQRGRSPPDKPNAAPNPRTERTVPVDG